MKTFKEYILEVENRLVHGTIKDHIKSIKQNWLRPGTSKYTKNYYDDVSPTLFLAHPNDLKRAYSSIRGQIGIKLKKHPNDVTPKDIENHGALIIARGDDNVYDIKRKNEDGTHQDMEGNKYYEDGPNHAEPGDYWTHKDIKPTGILTGPRLVKHLQNKGLIGK